MFQKHKAKVHQQWSTNFFQKGQFNGQFFKPIIQNPQSSKKIKKINFELGLDQCLHHSQDADSSQVSFLQRPGVSVGTTRLAKKKDKETLSQTLPNIRRLKINTCLQTIRFPDQIHNLQLKLSAQIKINSAASINLRKALFDLQQEIRSLNHMNFDLINQLNILKSSNESRSLSTRQDELLSRISLLQKKWTQEQRQVREVREELSEKCLELKSLRERVRMESERQEQGARARSCQRQQWNRLQTQFKFQIESYKQRYKILYLNFQNLKKASQQTNNYTLASPFPQTLQHSHPLSRNSQIQPLLNQIQQLRQALQAKRKKENQLEQQMNFFQKISTERQTKNQSLIQSLEQKIKQLKEESGQSQQKYSKRLQEVNNQYTQSLKMKSNQIRQRQYQLQSQKVKLEERLDEQSKKYQKQIQVLQSKIYNKQQEYIKLTSQFNLRKDNIQNTSARISSLSSQNQKLSIMLQTAQTSLRSLRAQKESLQSRLLILTKENKQLGQTIKSSETLNKQLIKLKQDFIEGLMRQNQVLASQLQVAQKSNFDLIQIFNKNEQSKNAHHQKIDQLAQILIKDKQKFQEERKTLLQLVQTQTSRKKNYFEQMQSNLINRNKMISDKDVQIKQMALKLKYMNTLISHPITVSQS